MYLLDTDICIYLINRHSKSILEKISKLLPDSIGISAITMAELEYGIEKSKKKIQNKDALILAFSPFEVFSFSESATGYYAELRIYLEKKGKVIGANDMLIAAQALELNRILVTNNEKEFNRIPKLKIENWTKS